MVCFNNQITGWPCKNPKFFSYHPLSTLSLEECRHAIIFSVIITLFSQQTFVKNYLKQNSSLLIDNGLKLLLLFIWC